MTSTVGSRVLGVVALAAIAVMGLLALVVSPADAVQGQAVRFLYLHVPSIWVAYGSFVLTAVASALYLGRRRRGSPAALRRWDRTAAVAAELGVLFTSITLFSGALWGKVTWGTYWQWDARLTTTALLLVTYLGYLALRRIPAESEIRAKRAAIMALVAVVNIPIVHYSVVWWRTLHQQASLSSGRRGELTAEMYWTLLYSWAAVTVFAFWIGMHRYRVARLEHMAEEASLAELMEQRRRESAEALHSSGSSAPLPHSPQAPSEQAPSEQAPSEQAPSGLAPSEQAQLRLAPSDSPLGTAAPTVAAEASP